MVGVITLFDIICKIVVAFFAIIGLIGFCRFLVQFSLIPKSVGRTVSVLKLSGHVEDIEYLLRDAVERLKWDGGSNDKFVLCIDEGMDQETAAICSLLARTEEMIKICGAEDSVKEIF